MWSDTVIGPTAQLRASAGLVAALRQRPTFEVFVHGVDNLGPEGPQVDVVIADCVHAMQLTSRKSAGRTVSWGDEDPCVDTQ